MSQPDEYDDIDPGRSGDRFVPSGWRIESTTGSAQWFHDLDPTGDIAHRVCIHRLPTEAVVLGSAQPRDLVRSDMAERQSVEVCRRRSGGGLVHIQPRSDLWIDIIVPHPSPLWDDDVGRSFHWLGRHWADVLRQHYGGRGMDLDWMVADKGARRPEGRLLCFADVGHGEVLCQGRKVVGLSQRRTRQWARLQGLLLVRGGHHRLRPLLDARSAADSMAEAGVDLGLSDSHGGEGGKGDDTADRCRLDRRLAAVLDSVDDVVGLPAGCPPPDRERLIDDFCRTLPAV